MFTTLDIPKSKRWITCFTIDACKTRTTFTVKTSLGVHTHTPCWQGSLSRHSSISDGIIRIFERGFTFWFVLLQPLKPNKFKHIILKQWFLNQTERETRVAFTKGFTYLTCFTFPVIVALTFKPILQIDADPIVCARWRSTLIKIWSEMRHDDLHVIILNVSFDIAYLLVNIYLWIKNGYWGKCIWKY